MEERGVERGRQRGTETEKNLARDTLYLMPNTKRKVHYTLKVKTHTDNHKSQMSRNISSKSKANSRDRKSAGSDETQMET